MDKIVNLLESLTKLPGIPGREDAVAGFLMKYDGIDAEERRMDYSGNTWISCRGPSGPPVVLTAHIDEVGMKVKRIEDDGRLSVIGHEFMDLRTLASETVQVWTSAGPRTAFVYAGQQTTKPADYAGLKPDIVRLDLGVVGKAAAEELGVVPGNPVTYDPAFHKLGGDVYCAKAFDDRSGVAAILRALQLSAGRRKHRPLFIGTVQEEIGGHGADSVNFDTKPGAIINVDICGGEVYSLPEPDRRPMLGKGPILHDGPEVSQGMLRSLIEIAAAGEIPVQRGAATGRGADQSILQKKCGGLPVFGIILPMAFYHGPRGLVHAGDVLNAAKLIAGALCDPGFVDKATKF